MKLSMKTIVYETLITALGKEKRRIVDWQDLNNYERALKKYCQEKKESLELFNDQEILSNNTTFWQTIILFEDEKEKKTYLVIPPTRKLEDIKESARKNLSNQEIKSLMQVSENLPKRKKKEIKNLEEIYKRFIKHQERKIIEDYHNKKIIRKEKRLTRV